MKNSSNKSQKYPLDRKFSSIEEAGQAKIDYIMASKPASYWEKLKKLLGNERQEKVLRFPTAA